MAPDRTLLATMVVATPAAGQDRPGALQVAAARITQFPDQRMADDQVFPIRASSAVADSGPLLLFRRAGYETEMKYLASGTNWWFGTPRSHDGNGLADWTEDQFRALAGSGRLESAWMMSRGIPLPIALASALVPGSWATLSR